MEKLQAITLVFLAFIDAAAVPRIITCIVKCSDEKEVIACLKRVKHILIFLILANGSWAIKAIVEYYFK